MSKTSSFLFSAFDKALAVVSIVGIGAVVAVFDDARVMIEAHAVPAALICIASGTLGYAIGCLISNRQTKSTIAEMNRNHSEELRALESERESLARDISELRKEHESQLDAERESRKREISELRAESGEKLESERKRHEAEVAALNESHAEQIASLERLKAENEAAMQADFESRLEAMRAEYDASAKEAAAAQRKSAKLDKIQRRLSVLSASQKELVAKALDEGTVHAPSFGCDAAYLRDLSVFVTSSMAGMLSGADYSVNPAFATEIREHREWLA